MNQLNPITARRSAVRARPVPGPQSVTVAFSVWAPQKARVLANGGACRQDQPYIAVTIGDSLTYVYDRAGLECYVKAWQGAARHNQGLRLPTTAAVTDPGTGPKELTVLCHTVGKQRYRTVAEQATQDSPAAIAVMVGSVTVRVHTTAALHSYLQAWTSADQLGAILDEPAVLVEPGRD